MNDASSAETLFSRWIHEVWSGDPVAADLVADEFVGHWPGRDVHGPAELEAIIAETHSAISELTLEIVLGPIVDGDLMAGRWIGSGRHSSGEVRFAGNDILRLADGRIVEYWTGTSSG